MQNIAREFNLSETVFIVPPRDSRALRRLRIFTPTRELPFAGHPTIGAVHVLVEAGIADIRGRHGEFALELEVGLVPIQGSRGARKGRRSCSSRRRALPEIGKPTALTRAELAQTDLRSSESDIVSDRDFAQAWSCGVPFVFVPVRDRAALAQGEPRQRGVEAGPARRVGLAAVRVLPRSGVARRRSLRARMFCAGVRHHGRPGRRAVAAAAFAGYLAAS